VYEEALLAESAPDEVDIERAAKKGEGRAGYDRI
jgi:hypothetical protein